ncbi:pilus assembly protein TadG-related protein [Hephaestia sp. GCM10023244]|uniref:pilus assembly protein TadG-related protein n=1 Tax=unclassified Hephaestia TaxID=2631281 RepID=UPI002077287C|nr:pilus assembly protein TadG-related protein [Hephaestia sp. MAHUQ-44]MCM8729479.1 pilus assembly protein TadG-related protein [Hephaestia sp. MAHUQ-44]
MIRAAATDRHAGIGVIVALAMPIAIGAAALAVDVGSATLATRRLQGVADAAALAAATDPAHADAAARRAVTAANLGGAVTVTASTGQYRADAALPVADRYTADATPADAARITLHAATPTYFGAIFGHRTIPIARSATAAQTRMASFAIGSRLASLDGGVLNALLSGLTGSSISLKALDYRALASADIDLFAWLDALRTQAHVSADSYDELLGTSVSVGDALIAAATVSPDSATADALRALAAQVGNATMPLDRLIDLGPLGDAQAGPEGLARLNVLSLVTSLLQRSSNTRRIRLDLGGAIAGLASTRVTIALGEPEEQSPWIAIGDTGAPIVRTAQARIYLEATTGTTALPGLAGLATLRLPLFIELASAEARLDAIDCPMPNARTVTLAARTNPGRAAIARIDPARLDDFTTPVALHPAKVLDTLLLDIEARAYLSLGAAEHWQSVRFEENDITAGTPKSVASSSAVGGVAQSLAQQMTLTPVFAGIPLPVGPLLGAIGGQLTLLAPGVDGLVNLVTGAAGVKYGEADLRVTGAKCGMARLVA